MASSGMASRAARIRASGDILRGNDWLGIGASFAGDYSSGLLFPGYADPYGTEPSWWLSHERFDGTPIGPHGPNIRTAGIIPSVTRCTGLIVDPVIRAPWAVESPTAAHPVPLWITDPMLLGGSPGANAAYLPAGQRLTGYEFWSTVLTHAIWWGRGVFIYAHDSVGQPLAGTLRILNPYMIAKDPETGRWVIDPHGDDPIETDFDGCWEMGGKQWCLAVVRGAPPADDATPSGVFTRHFDTIRVGAAVSRYVASTFSSGVPSGYLRATAPNTTDAEIAELKRKWMSAHGTGSREVAVLGATVEYQPIAISPVDAAVDKVHTTALMDVAHAFGLSSAWLDVGGGSLNYSNMVDRRRDLLDHTLTGWASQLMGTLSSLMPFGTEIRVVWATYTAPSPTEQIPALVQAVGAGLLSAAEARAMLGLASTPNATALFPDSTLPEAPMAGAGPQEAPVVQA